LIAAVLAKIIDVEVGFVEQLTHVTDLNLAEGVLNITDQILHAVDEDGSPETAGAEELLARIPKTFRSRFQKHDVHQHAPA